MRIGTILTGLFLVLASVVALHAQQTPAGNVGWYNGDCPSGIPGYSNWYTANQRFSRTYDDFVVPSGGWTVTGVFSINAMSVDRVTAAVWEIRTGVSTGNSGTVVASGMSPAAQTLLFTWPDGERMYRVQVDGLRARLAAGTYWLSVAPVVPYGNNSQSFVCGTSGKNAVGTPQGNNSNALFYSLVIPGNNFVDVVKSGGAGISGDFSQGVTIAGGSQSPAVPVISAVVNAASWQGGPVSPGEIVTILGTGVGASTTATMVLDPNGRAATSLGAVQVLIGGIAAPQTYVSSNQINAVVPYEVTANPTVTVVVEGQTSNAIPLTLTAAAPALFTADGSGSGQGAILNLDGSYNGPAHPASRGGYISLFLTGEGKTTSSLTGKITSLASATPLTPQPVLPVTAQIGGQPAYVQFYGEAPNLIAGLMQVNLQIPANVSAGNLPVVISVGTASTPSGVTVAVQ